MHSTAVQYSVVQIALLSLNVFYPIFSYIPREEHHILWTCVQEKNPLSLVFVSDEQTPLERLCSCRTIYYKGMDIISCSEVWDTFSSEVKVIKTHLYYKISSKRTEENGLEMF